MSLPNSLQFCAHLLAALPGNAAKPCRPNTFVQVRTFAYGTDASFYRLNPKMVVKVRTGGGAGALWLGGCSRGRQLAWLHSFALFFLCCGSVLPLQGPISAAPSLPQVHNEEEIRRILPLAQKHQVPVTFRAAGTSLSAQVCDGCLGRADGFWVVVPQGKWRLHLAEQALLDLPAAAALLLLQRPGCKRSTTPLSLRLPLIRR